MADEDKQEEGKRKLPLVKMLLLVVLVLLVLVGPIGATLFFTGYSDQKGERTAGAQLGQAGQRAKQAGTAVAAEAAAGGSGGAAQGLIKTSPEIPWFEYRGHEYGRDVLSNLTDSRKVTRLQVAVTSRHEGLITNNLNKYEPALRATALGVMRQATVAAGLEKRDLRHLMSERLRTGLNAVLEKPDDFGWLLEVFFTSCVVQ